jgi:hypothetical protein
VVSGCLSPARLGLPGTKPTKMQMSGRMGHLQPERVSTHHGAS